MGLEMKLNELRSPKEGESAVHFQFFFSFVSSAILRASDTGSSVINRRSCQFYRTSGLKLDILIAEKNADPVNTSCDELQKVRLRILLLYTFTFVAQLASHSSDFIWISL